MIVDVPNMSIAILFLAIFYFVYRSIPISVVFHRTDNQCCGAGPFLTGSGYFFPQAPTPAPAPAPIKSRL